MSNITQASSKLPVPVFAVPAPVLAPVDLNSPRKLGEGTGGVVELITDALTGHLPLGKDLNTDVLPMLNSIA